MSDETTAALVAQAKAGSAKAFEALVRRHLRAAYSVALAVVGVPAEAEDLAQEGLMVAYEKLDECRDADRFSGWLLNIVRNLARNHVERRKVRTDHAAAALEPAPGGFDPAQVGVRARLLSALQVLDERHREVVLLHDLEGWTHAEIAAALGLSEVNSRQHLFTARKALKAQLGDDAPEASHGS